MSIVRGVIFDLDGTLVDSGLDFNLMRREMQLAEGLPLLEAIDCLSEADARRCRAILARHEDEGAARATLMPGAAAFLDELHRRQLRTAVVTRNSRALAERVLARLGLAIDLVRGREDGPVKPDPASLRAICEGWGCHGPAAAIIGDYRFDLEAGRGAGIRTVLYTAGRDASKLDYSNLADRCLHSFAAAEDLLAWFAEPL